MVTRRKRVAVAKFTSCSGCELPILNWETELLDFAKVAEFAFFAMVSSELQPGPYDLTLVTGSISCPRDVEQVNYLRRNSRVLVAVGNCAVSGGPQALRNWLPMDRVVKGVYPNPDLLEIHDESVGIREYVDVDGFLKGCPVNKTQLLDYVTCFLMGKTPELSTRSVCMECKMKGNVCLIVAEGVACMGPVTSSGCGALCPSFDRGCYGCFGPSADPNLEAFGELCKDLGLKEEEVHRKFRYINSNDTAFVEGAKMYEAQKV